MRWAESLVRKAGLRRWSGVIVGMILLVLSGHTWAATCTGGGQSYTIPLPTSVRVPRDAAVGSLLSSWVTTPAANWYNCTQPASANSESGIGYESLLGTDTGLTVAPPPDGNVYHVNFIHVYNTNMPGVGIAMVGLVYLGGSGANCGSSYATDAAALWNYGCTLNALTTGTLGGQVEAVLVKTGPITGGTMPGGELLAAASYVQRRGYQPGVPVTFSVNSITFVAASCSTPNTTVSMGTYPASTFTGIGSTSTPVGFNVAVNNCPAGMKSIQYQFASANGVANASQGVITLAGDSTAKGIGLQLKSSSSNPNVVLSYNKPYTLTSYNAATGGSYTIPLTAAYYQTGTTVTPGTANGIVTFTMTYQ